MKGLDVDVADGKKRTHRRRMEFFKQVETGELQILRTDLSFYHIYTWTLPLGERRFSEPGRVSVHSTF